MPPHCLLMWTKPGAKEGAGSYRGFRVLQNGTDELGGPLQGSHTAARHPHSDCQARHTPLAFATKKTALILSPLKQKIKNRKEPRS